MMRITFPWTVRTWSLAAFVAGIGFCLVAVGSGMYFVNFRSHSLVATGTVTFVDVHADGNENLYCPHVHFEAVDKKTYTVACRIWQKGTAPEHSVGDVVPIRYKQNDPSDAFLESQVDDLPHESAIAALCALSVGFALRWCVRRRGVS